MTRREKWTLRGSLVLLVVGVVLLAAACGGSGKKAASATTETSGGSVQTKTFPEFKIIYDTGTRLPRPGPVLHDRGLGRHVERLPQPARVQARATGPTARRSCPNLAKSLPTGLIGRADVHVHAARRAQVLERHAGQGERLQVRDRAALQDRLARRRLLHEHRRRRQRSRKTKKGGISGIVDGRRDGHDHDQAHAAAGRLREHPCDDVRRAGPGRNAGEGPVDDADSVDRPVHDHRRTQPNKQRHARPQPELRSRLPKSRRRTPTR